MCSETTSLNLMHNDKCIILLLNHRLSYPQISLCEPNGGKSADREGKRRAGTGDCGVWQCGIDRVSQDTDAIRGKGFYRTMVDD